MAVPAFKMDAITITNEMNETTSNLSAQNMYWGLFYLSLLYDAQQIDEQNPFLYTERMFLNKRSPTVLGDHSFVCIVGRDSIPL